MAYRFNPAPGWPAPPEGWSPPEGWQPDPAWPPAPEGWEFWVWEEETDAGTQPTSPEPSTPSTSVPGVSVPSAEEPEAAPAVDTPAVSDPVSSDPGGPEAPDSPEVMELSGEAPELFSPEAQPADAPVASDPMPVSAEPKQPEQPEDPSPHMSMPTTAQPETAPGVEEQELPAPVSPDLGGADLPETPVVPAVDESSPQMPGASPADLTPPVAEAPATPEAGASATWGQPHPQQQVSPTPGSDAPTPSQQTYAGWGQGAPQQQYRPQPAVQHQMHQQTPPAPIHQHHAHPAPPKKKGKGLLIFLIILAVILAGAFVWALMGALKSRSAADAEPPAVIKPAVEAEPSAEPVVDSDAEEGPTEEADPTSEAETEEYDFETLALEAGLGDLLDMYNDFGLDPVSLEGDIVPLGDGGVAELTTMMVGPAASMMVQEVGTLTVSEPVLGWSPHNAAEPCPAPQDGNEYILVQLAANTAPALQDYPFSGVEIRFFDDAGEQTGVGNTVLTQLCFGDYGAVPTAWERGGGYAGGLLAQVTPGTASVAYSAQWGYGVDDTIYEWRLVDL